MSDVPYHRNSHINSQKVVSDRLRMNNLIDSTRCLVELDGILYQLMCSELLNGRSMWCELGRLERDFPRNFIYFGGRLFHVGFFSVSNSTAVIVHNLVIPRLVTRIFREGNSSSIGKLRFVEFIAFEFKSTLSEIETKSFAYYSSLRSICLPARVGYLGGSSFYSCKSLSSFTFESGSKLTRIGSCTLFGCSSLQSICIPSSVEFLGKESFSQCKSLSPLTFESGSKLTRIESKALYGCSSLKPICLPASVQFLGEYSFSECTALSACTFESGSRLTRIKDKAFYGCLSLQSICLPASLEEIDGSTLADTGISSITI
jgi:hypothetical protein